MMERDYMNRVCYMTPDGTLRHVTAAEYDAACRIRTGRLDPVAYTYEAAYHCPTCAARRFGVDSEGWIPESAVDGEGNPVGALAPWDEWQAFTGESETLACDTCGVVIDEYERSAQ